jgi:thiosulfate/3-mercaptopyruvate sulfurtransferase
MSRKLLWSVHDLNGVQVDGACIVVDCRFSLDQPDAGYRAWLEAHIPGARYAHLDNDLSSPITGTSGRHPLPGAAAFSAFLARLGWEPGMDMVVYDDMTGAIASRLWWLMKYFGHDCASMLDGGFAAWTGSGYRLESGSPNVRPSAPVELYQHDELVISSGQLLDGLIGGEIVPVDARASERFEGKIEPLDTVAGHIPGSINYPFQSNLDDAGLFRPASELRKNLAALASRREAAEYVHMCGSGVTACHNLFAAEMAGVAGGRLYAGSWSEWIRDPARPVTP